MKLLLACTIIFSALVASGQEPVSLGSSQSIHKHYTPDYVMGDEMFFINRPAYSNKVWTVYRKNIETGKFLTKEFRINTDKPIIEKSMVVDSLVYLFYSKQKKNNYCLFMQILDTENLEVKSERKILEFEKQYPDKSDIVRIQFSDDGEHFAVAILEVDSKISNNNHIKALSLFCFNAEGDKYSEGMTDLPGGLIFPYKVDPVMGIDISISQSGRCAVLVSSEGKKEPIDRRFFCYELQPTTDGLQFIDYSKTHGAIFDLRIGYIADTIQVILSTEKDVLWYKSDMNGTLNLHSEILRVHNKDWENIVGYYFKDNSLFLFTQVVEIRRELIYANNGTTSKVVYFDCWDKAVLYRIDVENKIGFTLMPNLKYVDRRVAAHRNRGFGVKGYFDDDRMVMVWSDDNGLYYATIDISEGVYIQEGNLEYSGKKKMYILSNKVNNFTHINKWDALSWRFGEKVKENPVYTRIKLME